MAKQKVEKAKITASSGNVFADLGFPDPAAELVKAELVRQIRGIIHRRGLSQTQAAKLLGIKQPNVSSLVRGKIGGFSTERLFRFLNALNQDVEISLKPARRKSGGTVRVVRNNKKTTRGTNSPERIAKPRIKKAARKRRAARASRKRK